MRKNTHDIPMEGTLMQILRLVRVRHDKEYEMIYFIVIRNAMERHVQYVL
jgi:hypothetical protein